MKYAVSIVLITIGLAGCNGGGGSVSTASVPPLTVTASPELTLAISPTPTVTPTEAATSTERHHRQHPSPSPSSTVSSNLSPHPLASGTATPVSTASSPAVSPTNSVGAAPGITSPAPAATKTVTPVSVTGTQNGTMVQLAGIVDYQHLSGKDQDGVDPSTLALPAGQSNVALPGRTIDVSQPIYVPVNADGHYNQKALDLLAQVGLQGIAPEPTAGGLPATGQSLTTGNDQMGSTTGLWQFANGPLKGVEYGIASAWGAQRQWGPLNVTALMQFGVEGNLESGDDAGHFTATYNLGPTSGNEGAGYLQLTTPYWSHVGAYNIFHSADAVSEIEFNEGSGNLLNGEIGYNVGPQGATGNGGTTTWNNQPISYRQRIITAANYLAQMNANEQGMHATGAGG